MKFIHIGDAHIRAQTWANLPSVSGDASHAIDIITAYAKKQKIKTLVLSGDVFHSAKPTSKDVQLLNKLTEVFKRVLYIEGNHEKSDPPWVESLGSPDKFYHLSADKPTKVDEVLFCGIDYSRSRDETLKQLDKVRDINEHFVLVMHNGFKHMINFEGASVVERKDLDGIDCHVFVSHVHKRHTLGNIHSPGPLFPQSWEEVGPCYVDVVDTDTWGIEALDVTVRSYFTIPVTDVQSFIDTPMKLPSVVRVLTSDPKEVIPEIPGCIVVPVVSGSSKEASDSSGIAVCTKTIEEAIMEEYEDPDDGSLMVELYKSESPKDFIDKFLSDNKIDRRSM